MKTCSNCGIRKGYGEFNKNNKSKDGYQCQCKKCAAEYNRKNRQRINENRKEWRKRNYDKYIKTRRKYTEDNREHISNYSKTWKQNNRERVRSHHSENLKNRYREDANFRITVNLRNRIGRLIKEQDASKNVSTIKLLGCTAEEFRLYFESLFVDGMTWDKYMNGEIHVDHIRPCSSFNLTDPQQQQECFHFTNLQPLWAEDNLKKGSKWEVSA